MRNPQSQNQGVLCKPLSASSLRHFDRSGRHDPNAEGAIVMKAPTKEHEAKFNKK